MALAITFYTYTGDPRIANKSLTDGFGGTTLSPLRPISNLKVEFDITYNANVVNANYCAIEGKTYKIIDRQRLPAQGLRIIAELDSLITYWNQVKNCEAIVERSTVQYNAKINDPKYPVEQKKTVEAKRLFSMRPENEIIFGYIE